MDHKLIDKNVGKYEQKSDKLLQNLELRKHFNGMFDSFRDHFRNGFKL